MRLPLVRPSLPKLSEVQEYYQLAEKQGHYSNFGLCYDIAIRKLQDIYSGSYPVLVNNGTTAIQVALQARLPRGSRVALPTYTFIATLNAVVAAGMTPVLFDVDKDTWQISEELLDYHDEKYDAILVVSPFGYAVNIASYDYLARSLDKSIIYDFAPAWGHPISKDNITTFSFHATKTLPIGEGGAVMCPDTSLQTHVRRLINFDLDNQIPQCQHGMNGKLDELHCAILCTQLDKNKEHLASIERTRRLLDYIKEAAITWTSRPKVSLNDSYPQLPVISIDDSKLAKIVKALDAKGVATKRYYNPLLHETFKDIPFYTKTKGRVNAPKNTIALPKPLHMNEVDDIVRTIVEALRS